MFQLTANANTMKTTVGVTPNSQQADTANATSPLFVVSCVVLPIVWGMFVHRVFGLIRRPRARQSSRDTSWPDFQI
ncbi:MAG: hypothetical protein R3C59_11400 [Planctomycetaceae bacterium]